MKLHRLELAGFGPFRERQSVDFDAFDGDGVFLITGRTGAGKSSILDGVSFALYGVVPRYDNGEKRLRSDHCFLDDPTEAVLEFTVGETRWRVTRAPEYQRPAKRGGGLTLEPTRAELEELVDGVWIGRAAKPRDVGVLLDEILGLNAQQFQQVILLAQNRFSRFLLARNDERQTLLRTLFGTRRFEEYRIALEERRKEAQKRVDAAGERTRTLIDLAEHLIADRGLTGSDDETPGDLPARRAAADRGLQRADYRAETAAQERSAVEVAHTAAAAHHADLVTRAKSRAALEVARRQLAALEEDQPDIDRDRGVLERAQAAEAVRATLESAAAAEIAHAAAVEAAADARARWLAVAEPSERSADLAPLIETLTGDLAVWAVAENAERDLVRHERELTARQAKVDGLVDDIAALDSQRSQLPAERAQLEAALTAAGTQAARRDDLRARRDTATAQLAAAQEADRLTAAQRSAEAEYAHRSAAATAAASVVTSLLQRRLAGFAGELAGRLVEGAACDVCGSTAHPHPASQDAEPVTDDDLAAAEAARDAASAADRRAADAARVAREQLTDAAARAGGRDVAAAVAEMAAAAAAVEEADAAAAEHERVTAVLADLVALDAESSNAREALAAALAAEREGLAALTAATGTVRTEVEAARGEYASVADRVARATARRDAARACLAADATVAERARARDAAFDDRTARVAASGFADAGEAESALRDESVRSAIAARTAEHAAALAGTRARALELELETVGDDTTEMDVIGAAGHLAAADAARTAAITAERDAVNTATGLRDLLVQIDAAYADVAAHADDAAVVTRLADTVAGRAPNTMKMDLETFVLAAELEEIVSAANLRLAEMSSGRYSLHHSDARAARGAASGLGIDVLDAHTGQLRSAHSLSGGETFLASLALALGLAEVVTGRAGGLRLDTLFIDEGFGSLDPETLELAMRTLDELRAGGRTVGVISHVEAMKEQLPAQLTVEATAQGPSVIRQGQLSARA